MTFVQSLWRLAKLYYIFGKLITSGVRKIMFTFAQPPLTLVAMATKIWEFQHIISCIWGWDITKHLAPNWGFTRLGNVMVSLKFNPDWPLLPWQQNFGNFKSKLAITCQLGLYKKCSREQCTVHTKQEVFVVGQFNDVTEFFLLGFESNKGVPYFTPFYPKLAPA